MQSTSPLFTFYRKKNITKLFFLVLCFCVCFSSNANTRPFVDSLQSVISVAGSNLSTITLCNSSNPIAISVVLTSTSGVNYTGTTTWETLGSGNFDDETALSTNYNPSQLDLSAGEVRLVFRPNCVCPNATDTVKIVFLPAIVLPSISTQAASFCNSCNGKLLLPIQNGVSPYTITYLRSGGGQTTVVLPINAVSGAAQIENLCFGTYQILSIVDANGCAATGGVLNVSTLVDKPTTPILGANSVQPTASLSCAICTGSVAIDILNGTAPFSVSYTSRLGAQILVNQSLNGNNALVLPNFCKDTIRNIRITDANNCAMQILPGPFFIGQPELPLIGSNGVTTQNASSCAVCDGKIAIQLSATQPGTSPYTVLFDSLGMTKTRTNLVLNANNQVVIKNLCPNSYTNIRLKDSVACNIISPVSLAGPFIIEQPNAPIIDTAFALNICGDSNNKVKIVLNSQNLGLSPYRIVLHSTAGNSTVFTNVVIIGNEIILNNVLGDTYDYISLQDARGCVVLYSKTIFVWKPFFVSLAATGCQPNGQVVASVQGNGAYGFQWSGLGNQNNTIITGLNTGVYTVTVTDNTTFCTKSSSILLKPCKAVVQASVPVFDSVMVCLPVSDLPHNASNPIVSVALCHAPANGRVVLNSPDSCFLFVNTAGFLGNTNFCVIQCNAQHICDTTEIVVNNYYVSPGTRIVYDTVDIGANATYCLNALLPGTVVNATQIYVNHPPNLLYEVTGNCLTYQGLSAGQDTAVFQICDNLGHCDTAMLYLTTYPRPRAEDDQLIVDNITLSVIDVMANDNLFGHEGWVSLLNNTSDGTIRVTQENKVSFAAYKDVCNRYATPYIRYKVCNGAGCDTAILSIFVTCKEDLKFEIFNAVSPNDDGINDYFTIQGIDKYPQNTLQIFNRWGALVYDTKGYKNNWNGDWNGYILPDGTYFYVLNLGDGSSAISGYLQLHR